MISKNVYSDNIKAFANRKKARVRHKKAEDEYNAQVGKFQDQAFAKMMKQ